MKVSNRFHAPVTLPLGKSPQYPVKRIVVGPRAGLDMMMRKNSCPCWELNPGHPACSLVTILSYYGFCYIYEQSIFYYLSLIVCKLVSVFL